MPCKHVIAIMRGQRSGAILNISSIAAVCNVGILAYKTSKAGVNAITNQLALSNAKYGIRVNCIMPGLMDTPMAIEGISKARGISKEQLRKERDGRHFESFRRPCKPADREARLRTDLARFLSRELNRHELITSLSQAGSSIATSRRAGVRRLTGSTERSIGRADTVNVEVR